MKKPRPSSLLPALLAIGLSAISALGGWTEVTVGSGNFKVAIGGGRNDGVTRVYSVHGSPGLLEYSWIGGTWNRVDINSFADTSSAQIGVARTDGITRLYCEGGEYTYAASTWNFSKSFGSGGDDLKLLRGRNDGVSRLYVAGASGFMHEYTWVAATTSYADLSMPYAPSTISRLEFGDARNDGTKRIYGVTTAGELCEWTYSDGWSVTTTPFGIGAMWDIAMGRLRPDGLNRLYLACADGLVYEVSWNGTAWIPVAIGFGTQEMWAVAAGNTRNDGIQRLWVGNQDGRIYELTYHNDHWTQDLVIQSSGEVQAITIGAGRGDGINRVYTAKGGSLKEYTYVPSTTPPFTAELHANGILQWSSTPGSVYDVEWSGDLATWHSDWSPMTGVQATGSTTQAPIPRFFRVKRRTE